VNLAPTAHATRPVAPWYGETGRSSLHRYLADDFVPQFLADLGDGSLATSEAKAWLQQDRFGQGGELVLRQPVHRAFYVLSAEVSCLVPGRPPLDPRKIASAGMVIRRRPPGGADEAWTLLRGVALGWEPALPDVDPEVARRIARLRGEFARDEGKPYSGEQVHPMHATTAVDDAGRTRTVIWGFVPVGSGSRPIEPPPAMRARLARGNTKKKGAAATELDAAKSDMAAKVAGALSLPFGTRAGTSARSDGRYLKDGQAAPALIELLDLLVRQLQVGATPARTENAAIEARLDRWPLLDQDGHAVGTSVLQWLRAIRRDPAESGSAVKDDEARLQAWLAAGAPLALTMSSSSYWGTRVPAAQRSDLNNRDLVVSADEAQQLRAELVESHGARVAQAIDDLVVPRFGQRDDDLYVAIPFVRVREAGCEHVWFGQPSREFRVAAPLDPEAARPIQIQLPKLSDLKKALPKASFLAPDDLAEKLLSIPGAKGLTPDLAPAAANAFGLCWMFSFSLPAITLCALIVLMIVLSLLDIVFRWMPYVFLRLPMFCLGIKKP
jgi:hypothetical protein